jgi:hypothetical protein
MNRKWLTVILIVLSVLFFLALACAGAKKERHWKRREVFLGE